LFFDLDESQTEGPLFLVISTAYRRLRHAIPHSSYVWLMTNSR
jgi:hypothetical protein